MLNKIFILFAILLLYSCNRSIVISDEKLSKSIHNQVVKLVIKDIISDKNNIIIGTPCINGYIRIDKYTVAPYGLFIENFIKENMDYSYEHIELDSNFIQKGIACKVSFCNNKESLDNEIVYKTNGCEKYLVFSFSSIVKGRENSMSIFLYGHNGDDPQFAEYVVSKIDNQWNIELKYETTNPILLKKNFDDFKRRGLKHF